MCVVAGNQKQHSKAPGGSSLGTQTPRKNGRRLRRITSDDIGTLMPREKITRDAMDHLTQHANKKEIYVSQ